MYIFTQFVSRLHQALDHFSLFVSKIEQRDYKKYHERKREAFRIGVTHQASAPKLCCPSKSVAGVNSTVCLRRFQIHPSLQTTFKIGQLLICNLELYFPSYYIKKLILSICPLILIASVALRNTLFIFFILTELAYLIIT